MKTLIIDDDFTSRKLLSKILSKYGETDVAVDGKEAVKAFKISLDENNPYDLLCLDIMMPEMNGQETLKEIRRLENEKGIYGLDGVKIIMVTALSDSQNICTAFREQCEAYIIKPIEKDKLLKKLYDFKLVSE